MQPRPKANRPTAEIAPWQLCRFLTPSDEARKLALDNRKTLSSEHRAMEETLVEMKPSSCSVTAETLAQAAPLVLQHPAIAADQHVICTLMLVCKASRQAVLQSSTSLLEVDVLVAPASLAGVAEFGSWIDKYAGLVGSINITDGSESRNTSYRQQRDMAIRSLECCLAQVASRDIAAASQDRVGAQGQLTQLQCWRLRSYIIDFSGASANLMSALPAATLTELRLSGVEETLADELAVAAQLSRLSNLQHLDLSFPTVDDASYAPDRVVVGMSGLKRLTSLRMAVDGCSYLSKLPAQLRSLDVDINHGKLDLEHLTALQRLVLFVEGEEPLSYGSKLPTQLEHLKLGDDSVSGSTFDRLHVTSLKCLHTLSVDTCFRCHSVTAPALKSLMGLQQLHELHLRGQCEDFVDATSKLWPFVTNLLSLGLEVYANTAAEVESMYKAVAGACHLKSLGLNLCYVVNPVNADPSTNDAHPVTVAVCGHLSGLTRLEHLDLNCTEGSDRVVVAEHDASHLTALTRLTKLSYGLHGGIDDAVVCTLALKLTRLEELFIYTTESKITTGPLPVINTLCGLRTLKLCPYDSRDAQYGLRLLTDLRNLRYLDGFENAGADAIAAFWSVLHP